MTWQDLAGKTALVTGASSGLGLHFARLLAGHGVRVILAARRVDAITALADEIKAAGGKAEPVVMDVVDSASVEKAFAAIGDRLDIVVNNAGISGAAAAIDMPLEDFDRVIDTNLKGVFTVAKAAAQRMRTEKSGAAIVNIACGWPASWRPMRHRRRPWCS